MKRFLLLILICLFVFVLQSCDLFRYPTGVWTCEELNIILDFDDKSDGDYDVTDKNGKIVHHGISGRGEILIDGVSFEIIAQLYVEAGLTIRVPHSDGKFNESGFRADWLFSGRLRYINRNKLEYTVTREIDGSSEKITEVYTFVRQ